MIDPYPSSASDDDDPEASAKFHNEIWAKAILRSKQNQIQKTVVTMATAESKEKRANIGRAQAVRARRRELELARATYVEFEPSKKRRSEMRRTSGERGLRNNPLLYMSDRYKHSIYRVSKDGDLKPRELVGSIRTDDKSETPAQLFPRGFPAPLID